MHIIRGEIVYDVGDRVVITRKALRESLYKTGHRDNDLWWNCEMNKFCGITATISSVTESHNYRIVEDEGRWVWCNTFFEGLESSLYTQEIIDEEGDLEPCSFGNYFKEYRVI